MDSGALDDRPLEVLCIGMAVVDVFVRGDARVGDDGPITVVDSITLRSGGDALNQAINLARLGHRSGLMAVLGRDAAATVVHAELDAAGVDASYVTISSRAPTTVTVIFPSPDGDPRYVTCESGTAAVLDRADLSAADLPEGLKVFSVGSLGCSRVLDLEVLPRLLDRAHERGAITVADMVDNPGAATLDELEPVLSRLDYVIPSYQEARHFTGYDDPAAAAEAFRSRGVGTTIVKLGSRGVAAFVGASPLFVPAYPVTPVDATGCGDSFVAGFISGLLEELPIEACLERGTGTAAITLQAVGATGAVRSREQVQRLVDDMRDQTRHDGH